MAVLVVAHTGDQALDKLHLVGLRPLVKQGDAVFLLLLIVSLRRSLTRAHYRSVSMLQRATRALLTEFYILTLKYLTGLKS